MCFAKKYVPSATANNAKCEELKKQLNALVFFIEKGKYNKQLDKETVDKVLEMLKKSYNEVEGLLFTGDEDLRKIGASTSEAVVALKKSLGQIYSGRLEENADSLQFCIDTLSEICNDPDATALLDSFEENEQAARKTAAQKRLFDRLAELDTIKTALEGQNNRLERDIQSKERDLAELENMMVKEDNERQINELYRKISAAKSIIGNLNVRRENYSACFNVLDMIYANAAEILQSSFFSPAEIGKAKALLNIDKLKNVVTEPDKAIAILKVMQKDIEKIALGVGAMDQKVFGQHGTSTTVSQDALAYKEELMRKIRERNQTNADIASLTPPTKRTLDTPDDVADPAATKTNNKK